MGNLKGSTINRSFCLTDTLHFGMIGSSGKQTDLSLVGDHPEHDAKRLHARLVELVYTLRLGRSAARHEGSTPLTGTQ